MKLYKLTFRSLSSITRIPDAQTIFGAICTIISFTQGEEKVQEYLKSFNSKPLFVHSSMFMDGVLPMPKIGLVSIDEKNEAIFKLPPDKQLKQLSELKKLKKVNYITLELYKKYMEQDKFEELKKDILSNKLSIEKGVISNTAYMYNHSSQLTIHNNHEETQNDSRRLYYDMNEFYNDNARFCIYVKTDDIELVKNIFKYSQYFGFGNRVSVGKNCFELLDVIEIDKSKVISSKKVLLSKCISTEFDLEESSYIIESDVYLGSKYYSSNKIGRFNKFVEGSYMKAREDKEYYGTVIKCNNGREIYHYGIGFVL